MWSAMVVEVMGFKELIECRIIERLTRFTALVDIGGAKEVAYIGNTGRVSPRQSFVVSCVFLALGFPRFARVFIASLRGLSGLHTTQEPLIRFNPLTRILGASTWGLPNSHQCEFTGVLKALGV